MKTILTFVLLTLLCASNLNAEIYLTVYQRDLVLVRDLRTVDLQKGDNRMVFTGVAPGLYEPTLRITPASGADLKTLELNYENDLASQDRIWKKHLGKPFQFTKDDSTYKGILRNFDDDFLYLEPDGRPGALSLVERSGVKNLIFEVLPQGLVLRPEVVWQVSSPNARKNVKVELSYLAKGLTWQADYAATLLNDNRLRLQGNLTLTNSLDLDFPDARLDLIAGSPHRTGDARQLSEEDALTQPQEKSPETAARFFEYRHYEVPEPTFLHAAQTKSLPLIGPVEVAAERKFFFDGSSGMEEVEVHLVFDNSKASGLGIALPEGDLLLYQADKQKHELFLGEDHLKASGAGDKVELIVGKAFDLRVDRKRVDHERLARNKTRDTVEIIFTSSREKSAKITVRERLYGYWEITEALWDGKALTHRAEDYNRIEFDVEIPPSTTKTLRYVVEYGY